MPRSETSDSQSSTRCTDTDMKGVHLDPISAVAVMKNPDLIRYASKIEIEVSMLSSEMIVVV